MATHDSLQESGWISFWLGKYLKEIDIDDYLHTRFPIDFGFKIYLPAAPEYDFSETGPRPIAELLKGFSLWDLFVTDAVESAKEKGWNEATAALVFSGLHYDPSLANPSPDCPLEFIASVRTKKKDSHRQ